VSAVNFKSPRLGNTGGYKYKMDGVRSGAGKGGVVQVGSGKIGEPGATWRVGLEVVSMKTRLVRGRGERASEAGRASPTDQTTTQDRGHRSEATKRIAGGAAWVEAA